MIITENNWNQFAKAIAAEGNPNLHSPAAMERFMNIARPYIYDVRTPSGKFKSRNSCELIDIPSEEGRKHYLGAEQRLAEKQAKLMESDGKNRNFAQLAIFNEYRMASEDVLAESVAERIHNVLRRGDKVSGAAFCFRRPLARIARLLVSKYGYDRNDISMIWGGDELAECTLDLKDAAKLAQEIYAGNSDEGKVNGRLLKQVQLLVTETEQQREERLHDYGQDMRLGPQSRDERQKEIDRYQTGKTRVALYSYAAGGVGLSLHHTDVGPTGKPVDLLPREGFLSPTYSAQDFVQGLGRFHRSIFSLSDTDQHILFFRGTIQEAVMSTVSVKLKCLKKVVSSKEQWFSATWEGKSTHEAEEAAREELDQYADDDDNVNLLDYQNDDDEETED